MRSNPEPEPPRERGGRLGRLGSDATDRHAAGTYLTVGMTFGVALLLFTGLGYWLDTRLHTLPLLTIVGAVVGGVGGFLHLYRTLTSSQDSERSRS